MLCNNCGQDNEHDAIYCVKCGMTIKPSGKRRVEDVLFVPPRQKVKTTSNWLLIVVALIIAGLVFITVFIALEDKDLSSSSIELPASQSHNNQSQKYTSIEHKFSALFPAYPSITNQERQTLDNGYSFTSTEISSIDDDGTDYYVQVGDYDIPTNSYDSKMGLEGAINVIDNTGIVEVSDANFTTMNGFDSITFSLTGTNEKYSGKGMAIIRDDSDFVKVYLIMIGSPSGENIKYQQFINSLEFK